MRCVCSRLFDCCRYLPCQDCEFDPQLSLNDEDIKDMQSWGFNLVRLGIMWVAVEPERGVYNYTFLAEARRLVDRLEAAGIATLIDMHQDVFSPLTCGEGFPAFIAQDAITSTACNESLIEKIAHGTKLCKSIREYDINFDEQGNANVSQCLNYGFSGFYGRWKYAPGDRDARAEVYVR
jgi:hypothetical protein